MNSVERKKKFYNNEKIDRIPINSGVGGFFSLVNSEYTAKEYYLNPRLAYTLGKIAIDSFEEEGTPTYFIQDGYNVDFGGTIFLPERKNGFTKVNKRAIETLDDIDKMVQPNLNTSKHIKKLIEYADVLYENNNLISVKSASALGIAQHLTGTTNLMRWMVKEKNKVHQLLRLCTDFIKNNLKYHVDRYGAEKVNLFNTYPLDSEELISRKLFEEISLPYIVEIHQYALDIGIKSFTEHLCGNHSNSVIYWAKEIPLAPRTTFHIGMDNDVLETAKIVGSEHVIGGGVPNTLLQTGSPQKIYNYTIDLVNKVKHIEGGYMLMTDCTLSPFAPPTNVFAMIAAGKKAGKF